jgi:hypothetical protein
VRAGELGEAERLVEAEQQEQGRCTDQEEGYHPGETATGSVAEKAGVGAGEPEPGVKLELEVGRRVVEHGEAERCMH